MISPQQIAYILAVVEHHSISKAAQHCFVTQPTLSMQLKKAEEVLGRPVFLRDTSKIELSEFGKALIPILRQIQGDFSSIERVQKEFEGTYTERLRIGIIPTVAPYLLLNQFEEWQALLPNTLVYVEELKTEELLEAIEQRRVDLGILAGPVHDTTIRVTPLFQEEIKVYAPSIEGDPLLVDSLKELQPWLLNKGNCLRTQMMEFCELNGDLPPKWNYQGGNMEMLMRMVDQQGGYTLIPEYYMPLVNAISGFKSIRDEQGHFPGRSIIGISPFRHNNWESLEKIIRSIQHFYNKAHTKEMELLSWK